MRKDFEAIKTLLPLLRLYPWAVPTIILMGLLASLSEGLGISLLVPFLQNMGGANNSVVSDNFFLQMICQPFNRFPPQQRLWAVTTAIVSIILFKGVLAYLYTVLSYWLEQHVLHQIRTSLLQRLMSAGKKFWDDHESGKLLNTLAKESQSCGHAIQRFVWLTVSLCMILVFTFILLLISPRLTLMLGVTMVIISAIVRRLTNKVEGLGKQSVEANALLSRLMIGVLTGIKTIMSFSREHYEQNRFEEASKKTRDLIVSIWRRSSIVKPMSEGLAVIVFVCLLILAFESRINISIVVTFTFMLYRLQPQFNQFEGNRNMILAYKSSVQNVISLLQRSDRPSIPSGTKVFTGLERGISFEGVTFQYNGKNGCALSDVSIYFPAGSSTALVGLSGAGKSTLINLIFRFYDATSGDIFVDGCPLREFDLASWRSRIAMVSEDVHLFNTTVRENIAYGRPDATEEEIVDAAKKAYCHEFISNLPQGYETKVGDWGVRLSGGQKQRISIARAILCDHEILILDEATNALDGISERYIYDSIENMSGRRTVIVVAHRLSTVEKADRIVVMEQSRVVEEGTFHDLMKNNGLFSRLHRLQFENRPAGVNAPMTT